jgi:hypothetical protein
MGPEMSSLAATYHACCAALTAHLAELETNSHRYHFGALDEMLLKSALATLQQVQSGAT